MKSNYYNCNLLEKLNYNNMQFLKRNHKKLQISIAILYYNNVQLYTKKAKINYLIIINILYLIFF